MSKAIRAHLPCDKCGSSDALTEYEDGTFCFSCRKGDRAEESVADGRYDREITAVLRGLSLGTVKLYDIRTRVRRDNSIVSFVFPYGNNTGRKVRYSDSKVFLSEGTMAGKPSLFGRDKFSPAQAKCVTITEGEIDAASVYEMLDGRYPAVSVRSSSSAEADCKAEHSFLNSFDKIYLAFDNDDVGQRAAAKVALLFDVNKVYHVKMGKFKDANEHLMNGAAKEFVSCWWNAKRYQPKGIISSWSDIDAAIDEKAHESIATYPFPTLNDMLYGIRTQEFILFKGLEKIGKTEVFRAIEHHLLKTTDHNMAIIHLEEKEARTIRGLAGYELKAPCHLPDCTIPNDDIKRVYRDLTRRDDRVSIYTHFGSDDPDSIVDMVRYLAAVNSCKFIFLDNITILATSQESDDERRKLDYVSTKLATLTRDNDFCLFCISHVNQNGDTRGSKNISKVADVIIDLKREKDHEDPEIRKHTRLTVVGNRPIGLSGPAGIITMDDAYVLSELNTITNQEMAFGR